MFEVRPQGGFKMTFCTGYTLSVWFGYGAYCSGGTGERYSQLREKFFKNPGLESITAEKVEIAVWPKDGEMVQLNEYDTVAGWVGVTRVGKLVGYLAEGGTDLDQMKAILEEEDG